MVLGDEETRKEETRRLAGNPDPTEWTDTQVINGLNRQDNWVKVETNEFNWVSTDPEWPQVLDASNRMTAAEFLHSRKDPQSKADAAALETSARDIVKAINRMAPEQGSPDSVIVSYAPDYRTDPLAERED